MKEEQPKKTAKDIFSHESLELLLMEAKFGHELKTPDEVAVHNDRMRIIRGVIGDDEKMHKFVREVVSVIFSV